MRWMTAAVATVLGSWLTGCGSQGNGDVDWLQFDLEPLRRYTFELAYEWDEGQLLGDLGRGNRGVLAVYFDHSPRDYAFSGSAPERFHLSIQRNGLGQRQPERYRLTITPGPKVQCASNQDCGLSEACREFVCAPAPYGERCVKPIEVASYPFFLETVTRDFSDDFGFASTACTGKATAGGDVFYRLAVKAGQRFMIRAVPIEADVALYLLDGCSASPAPAEACLAGVDAVFFDQPEILTYTAKKDGALLLGVDSAEPHPWGLVQLSIERS